MSIPNPQPFKGFPWATLGRRETGEEFFKKHAEQRGRTSLVAGRPKISLVVAMPHRIPEAHFALAVSALHLQSYPNWEAIFVAVPEAKGLEKVMTEKGDRRMRWLDVPAGASEAELKNLGAKELRGDWLGFPEADAVLSPVALFLFLTVAREVASYEVVFANEVAISGDPPQLERFFSKMELSALNLAHFNAVGKPALIHRTAWDALGGFAVEAGVHHEHDLYLRLVERSAKAIHLPFFLYYRRSEEAAPDSLLEERVKAHLVRQREKARVRIHDGHLEVTPEIECPEKHLINVIIPFRDRADWTVRCLEALALQAGRVPIELILVNNQSMPSELAKVRAAMEHFPHPVKLVAYEGPFNFAELHNEAIRSHCAGDLLLLLNNDVFLKGAAILDEMAAWALDPRVGTVGICLRYAHGAIQHSGIRARFGGGARMARVGHFPEEDWFARATHEVYANTFAACLFRKALFLELGGLRAIDLANGFGDVAFNFECLRRGLSNLYLGQLEGTHLESASRGLDYEYWEELVIEREYPDILQKMLRQDLGYNRVPEAEYSVPAFLRGAIAHGLRSHAPWLDPLKPPVKKLLRSFKRRGERGESASS